MTATRITPTKSTWQLRYAEADVHLIDGTFYAFLAGCDDPIASDVEIEEVLESAQLSYLERVREQGQRDAADEAAAYHARCRCAASRNPNAECVCDEWEAMTAEHPVSEEDMAEYVGARVRTLVNQYLKACEGDTVPSVPNFARWLTMHSKV